MSAMPLPSISADEARAEFVAAMTQAGCTPIDPWEIDTSGSITRFRIDGDRHGSKNGWCVLHVDHHGAAGAFGSWRLGITGTWRSGRGPINSAERAQLRDAINFARRERKVELSHRRDAAAQRAVEIWASAGAADPNHPYLKRKHVQPHGVRQLDDRVVIPARDRNGKLWTLQFINANGRKRFLTGGQKAGHYFGIGLIDSSRADHELLIAEGFATAASIHEATGKPVAIAFDAGNLQPVARALRVKFPKARITIAADNDTHTAGNPGLTRAREAAKAVGGFVVIPPEPFNDFNDVAVAEAKERQ